MSESRSHSRHPSNLVDVLGYWPQMMYEWMGPAISTMWGVPPGATGGLAPLGFGPMLVAPWVVPWMVAMRWTEMWMTPFVWDPAGTPTSTHAAWERLVPPLERSWETTESQRGDRRS